MTPPNVGRGEVERFRTMLSQRFGLHHEDGKLDTLADVLRQRTDATGSPSAEAYLEWARHLPRRADELRALATLLTINETYFFRNADNFRAFSEHVLPERAEARAAQRRLRLLSAGCASGEEPYSLAIAVREALPDFERWEVQIVGVDLSRAMVARAQAGLYSAWSLRATPEDVRRRYFRPEGRDFLLDEKIRAMVTFEERNLSEDDPVLWQPGSYDAVFCRNVIMYFTPEVMRDVVRRAEQSLQPGGYLFLGHAETLRGLSQSFHLCHTHDTFYYQKRRGHMPSRPAPSFGPGTPDPFADALPAAFESTTSWVEAIARATERISALAGTAAALEHGRSADTGPAALDRERANDTAAAAAPAPPPAPAAGPGGLGLALEAMRQERYTEALAHVNALPPDAHGTPEALLLHAVLLTNGGRLTEAEAVCARLLAVDELSAGAHYVMALCREHAGDAAGAVEHDQTALYLDPGFAMPHLHLGLAARRAGDLDTARVELGLALAGLASEDAARVLMFGGGFSRETLLALCRAELRAAGGGGGGP